ncbi:MAG: membrane protein insertase YidC, partial [bacterium]
GFSGNYGVAIIMLTVVVRVGMFPLTYKGMVSMKRMQKIQPRVVAMKEKFKNDRERQNKEMMALYKRYKVNPLGGCLPIALQLPIFFALYSSLLGAIELRHAPFMFWIADLSAKDPLYVTPILMGATMFLQQKLTPTAMDPTQQKILQFMPLIFLVFMINFPSGLVLYWLTSNTLSILQQLIINRIKVPEPTD